MTQEPHKSNIVLIVAIIGVIGTTVGAIINVIGNYNIEKLRQESELTRIVLVSIATQGGATQVSMESTISAPTIPLYPTQSPFPQDTNTPIPISTQTPDTRLFWDDFEMGLKPEWITLKGYCTMSNGRLTCSEGDSRIEVGDFSWSNYKLTFDTGSYWMPGGAAVLIKINSEGAYLKLVIPECNNAFWVYHGSDGSEQNISNVKGGACENGTVHFEIDSAQNGIYITKINGSAVGNFQDNRMPTGRVGFQINGPWFDNIVVSSLEP
jgi:hypothetical protein